jgi:prevent-host-death family protein
MTLRSFGIREFKAWLNELLRKVRKGQIIMITDCGGPVGRIPELEPVERRLQALREAGCISWNGRRLGARQPIARVRGRRMVSDLIVGDRR